MWHVGLLYRVHDLLVAVAEDQPDGRMLQEAFRVFRGVRLRDVLDLATKANWLASSTDGVYIVTAQGRRLVEMSDSVMRLREQIAELMTLLRPMWAMTITQGREALCRYAPPEVSQCFHEAGLLSSTADDVVEWWDKRASLFRAARDAQLVDIGRTGERLSLAFERARNGVEARWISLDYNNTGYDLLSRVSSDDARPLAIEVKTSSKPWESALFYVSRHEWEVLSEQEHAVIHLWNIAGVPYKHAVVPLDELSQHVASDRGEGRWETLACPYNVWFPIDFNQAE